MEHSKLKERLIEEGQETFKSSENFEKWMNTKWDVLDQKRPKDLLESESNINYLIDTVIRIRYGIPSKRWS